MPAQATITVVDSETESHVFTPRGVFQENGEIVARWAFGGSELTAGQEIIQMFHRTKKDGGVSVRMSLVQPKVSDINGQATIVRNIRATVTFDIPANSTEADRAMLHSCLSDLIADGTNSPVKDVIENNEPVW